MCFHMYQVRNVLVWMLLQRMEVFPFIKLYLNALLLFQREIKQCRIVNMKVYLHSNIYLCIWFEMESVYNVRCALSGT